MGGVNKLIPFCLIVWGQTRIESGFAAISTSLAYIIYFHILAASGPTNLLLVTLLINKIPPFGFQSNN